MAKLDQISVGGTIYEMVPEIAPLFNESTAYAVGDCVIKDAVLYRFTTAHAAGAWIGTDAEEITVGEELTDLKADFNEISEHENLFDALLAIDGYRISSDGNDYKDTAYYVSAYIPVTDRVTYTKNSPTLDAYHRMALYTASKTLSRTIESSNSVTTQAGETYIRICGLLTEKSTSTLYASNRFTAIDKTARNVLNDIDKVINGTPISMKYGYIDTSGATVDITTITSSTKWKYGIVDCTEGDAFTINADSGNAPRAWCFIDNSGNSLAVAESNITVNDLILTAPTNVSKLIVHSMTDSVSYIGKTLDANLDDIETRVINAQNAIARLDEDTTADINNIVDGNLPININDVLDAYTNFVIGATIKFTSSTKTKTIKKLLKVTAGTSYCINIKDGQTPAAISSRSIVITDANDIIGQAITYTNVADEISSIEFVADIDGDVYVCVDANYESVIVRGGYTHNKIEEITSSIVNQAEEINTIKEDVYDNITKQKDHVAWRQYNINGNTGSYTSKSANVLCRMVPIYDYTLSITDNDDSLVAFIYSWNGNYLGVWHGKDNELQKKHEYTGAKFATINFEEIRKKHPNCLIIVECMKSGIGDLPDYPNDNIEISIKNDESYQSTKETLNLGNWYRGDIAYGSGRVNDISTSIRTVNYVPEYVSLVHIHNISLKTAIYDEQDSYVGSWLSKGGTSKTHSTDLYLEEVDFELLRKIYPGYKFKLSMVATYGSSEYGEVFNESDYCIINTTAKEKYNFNISSYHIPTRFTREIVYTEAIEVTTNASSQSMCTDGEYLYIGALHDGYPYIHKIDLSGQLILTERMSENIGHVNDLAYRQTDNKIYAIDYQRYPTRVWIINPDTLAIENNIELQALSTKVETAIEIENPLFYALSYINIKGNEIFVLRSNNGFVFTDVTFTKVLKIIKNYYKTVGSNRNTQAIYTTDDYIVNVYTSYPEVDIYDWHGNILCQYGLPSGLGTGFAEVEAVLEINGVWYQLWNKSSLDSILVVKGNPIGYEEVFVSNVMKQFNLSY